MELCNQLLEKCGEKNKSNSASAIYSIWNLITHQYRNISDKYYTKIDEINTVFIHVLVEICNTFKNQPIRGETL
ncbi:hypothetical protein [Clostridium sulfidigenes]|uniref:hypothetical protein n=1 Tax=Clostridium sulfidigenes TaxID=318464 RepID=UPI003F8C246A